MARILPSMIHLRSFRSVYQMACHYLKDPKLRQVFSFHPLLVGGNPFNTSSIYTLILYLERRYGVYFPRGGTTQLVNSLLQLFLRKGGVFHANSPVKHIVVREKMARGIRLENGQEYVADIVVANSDVAWTYKHLIAPEYRRHWTNRRLARQRYSMGLFVWYFGTNKQYTDVAHHTILLGARYKELLLDIFQRKILAEDFSLYVHRPTATDPTLAPPGGDTFYVLSPVPNLQGKINWAEVAPRYQKKLAKFLEQTILPELEAHLVESFWVTPEYFANTLWSEAGAAFSMEPTLTQSAYFRPHNQSEDIQNLFFVGAGTHPGAGLPGVLSSAKVLEHILPAAAACVA
jgi:phytoene desaturase